MLFTRKLAWSELASIDKAGFWGSRWIRVTLHAIDPPLRRDGGALGRWIRKNDVSAQVPYPLTLSGWQIDFERDELLAELQKRLEQ